MKKELKYFYSSVNEENIFVVGTPQFEPYVMDKYKVSENKFHANFGLDINKKTICFSCGDLSTGRNDQLSISIIADAINESRISQPVNLLVRTSPADDGSRFNDVKEKYPFIIWNKPKWIQTREKHAEPWSQRLPLQEDIKDLRSILEYSDLGINMCSTMSLDFMVFGKPVINQVLGNMENGLFDDQRFLKYNHYKTVIESGAVVLAKTPDKLLNSINDLLNNPVQTSNEQKNILKLEISKPLEGTSSRIVDALLELSK